MGMKGKKEGQEGKTEGQGTKAYDGVKKDKEGEILRKECQRKTIKQGK